MPHVMNSLENIAVVKIMHKEICLKTVQKCSVMQSSRYAILNKFYSLLAWTGETI